MIFGKKKETTEDVKKEDVEKMKMITELLDLRAVSLDVKITLEGVAIECKTNKIAKGILLDVCGVSEEDFRGVVNIMKKAGQEIGETLELYGEVLNESEKKDKN